MMEPDAGKRWRSVVGPALVCALAVLGMTGCGLGLSELPALLIAGALALASLVGFGGCLDGFRAGAVGASEADVAGPEVAPSEPDPVVAEDDTDDPSEPVVVDQDHDGIEDHEDNCPLVANPEQEPAEDPTSPYGDACFLGWPMVTHACGPPVGLDSDGDGFVDTLDGCPYTPSDENLDQDGDGVGDVCDQVADRDGDGVLDGDDNCPLVANPDQAIADSACTAYGDACTLCPVCETACGEHCCYDADGDGLAGGAPGWVDGCQPFIRYDDNCPFVVNPGQSDRDGDAVGDACDNCPDADNPYQWDADNNGVGDLCAPSPSAALWPRDEARRHGLLTAQLVRGAISSTAFLDAHGGDPKAARHALAAALRARFVRDGVLPVADA